jgi:hypothetical protein
MGCTSTFERGEKVFLTFLVASPAEGEDESPTATFARLLCEAVGWELLADSQRPAVRFPSGLLPTLDGPVKGHLRHIPWWRWGPAVVLLGAVVYVLDTDGVLPVIVGIAAVLGALAAIAQAVLQVWNPFEPRPKPHLTLRPVDGEETTSFTVRTILRPVDVDAVVKEAEATARALVSTTGLVAMSQYAKPSKADHDKFEDALATYKEDVRAWAQEGEAWLRAQARVLVAEVIHHNPSSVDALEAAIYIFLPPESEEYEEIEPPEVPKRPMFPRRKSALAGGLFELPGPGAGTWDRPRFASLRTDPLDSMQRVETYSPDAPAYESKRDGTLGVVYGRWPIRHREDEIAGEPFSVRLPVGEHKVRWEVRATNLPHHATGTWTLAVEAESAAEPIKAVAQLEAALRGEPEVTVDRAAILRNLLRKR